MYYLHEDTIVVVANDGEPVVIARIEPGLEESVRCMLRYAQAGNEAERVVDRLVHDTNAHHRGEWIPCLVFVQDE